MLALFLGALDQTIVGTALPQIITELNGANLYTWVVTIYLLASTVTVPIYGKLSDMYGRKPLLLTGVGLFLAGSALAGLSQTIEQLILFRGIQGLAPAPSSPSRSPRLETSSARRSAAAIRGSSVRSSASPAWSAPRSAAG